jgi:hypothetical protein
MFIVQISTLFKLFHNLIINRFYLFYFTHVIFYNVCNSELYNFVTKCYINILSSIQLDFDLFFILIIYIIDPIYFSLLELIFFFMQFLADIGILLLSF